MGVGAGLFMGGAAMDKAAAEQSSTLFPLPRTLLPIAGRAALFPVRRIYCIGRNYADHAKEMGSDPRSEPPFFFQKPGDAVQPIPAETVVDHPYPPLTKNYHHELELVAVLHGGGRDIPVADALAHVFGYAVGLDMTRRDLQQVMKDQRKPWEIGKSFDRSAPIGPIIPVARAGHVAKGAIVLSVNGVARQEDDVSRMIWSVAEQISKLSESDELVAGDLIFSGTPAGVGPVTRGDVLVGRIAGLPDLTIKVT